MDVVIQEMRWCRLPVPFLSALNCLRMVGLNIVQVEWIFKLS